MLKKKYCKCVKKTIYNNFFFFNLDDIGWKSDHIWHFNINSFSNYIRTAPLKYIYSDTLMPCVCNYEQTVDPLLIRLSDISYTYNVLAGETRDLGWWQYQINHSATFLVIALPLFLQCSHFSYFIVCNKKKVLHHTDNKVNKLKEG